VQIYNAILCKLHAQGRASDQRLSFRCSCDVGDVKITDVAFLPPEPEANNDNEEGSKQPRSIRNQAAKSGGGSESPDKAGADPGKRFIQSVAVRGSTPLRQMPEPESGGCFNWGWCLNAVGVNFCGLSRAMLQCRSVKQSERIMVFYRQMPVPESGGCLTWGRLNRSVNLLSSYDALQRQKVR
jgi:hypothetical protein